MVRKFVLAVLALGMFGVAANWVLAPEAQGAQWYPFYGYHRPSYLGGPCVVAVQPSAPQVSTAYYPPAQDTAVPAQPTSPRQYNATQWYPFYGNHRPSYLDR
jgi:hypothetical protein